MKGSHLRKKFQKTKGEIGRKVYDKQGNLCASYIRQEKEVFSTNVNIKNMMNNSILWKTMRPVFTDKISTRLKVTLIENK